MHLNQRRFPKRHISPEGKNSVDVRSDNKKKYVGTLGGRASKIMKISASQTFSRVTQRAGTPGIDKTLIRDEVYRCAGSSKSK